MFAGIREAMRTPLAKPPGRQKWFAMVSPAWWAAAVYAVFAVAFWWEVLAQGRAYRPLIAGTAFAWLVAAMIMFVGAIVSGALALASERSRGTMDALLMTPLNHEKLVRGRYWHCLAPWLRFFIYLLPLYVLLEGTRLFGEAFKGSGGFWVLSGLCSFSNKGVFATVLVGEGMSDGMIEWTAGGVFLLLLRMANDLSVLLLAYSVAFCISARVASSARALALASIVVPVALIFVLAPHDLLLVGMIVASAFDMDPGRGYREAIMIAYGLLGLAAFLVRWLLVWWLARAARRNFGRWATDAKAG